MKVLEGNWKKAEAEIYRLDDIFDKCKQVGSVRVCFVCLFILLAGMGIFRKFPENPCIKSIGKSFFSGNFRIFC